MTKTYGGSRSMTTDLVVTDAHIRNSNLIEGVNSTVDDTSLMRAWMYLRDLKSIELQTVLHAHHIFMKDHMPEAGHLRDTWVHVRRVSDGETHYFPAPADVPGLLSVWLAKMTAPTFVDPIEMHVLFEKIHPFRDGNGRIGRLLLWWHQIKLFRQPLLILESEKRDYYNLFEEFDTPLFDQEP